MTPASAMIHPALTGRGHHARAMAGLDIDEHMQFQRQEWSVERIGWVATWLFVLSGLLGLTGTGPISSSTRESGNLRAEYARFTHVSKPTPIRLTLHPAEGESPEVAISGDLLRVFEISGIIPQPQKQTPRKDGAIVYTFESPPGSPEFDVVIHGRIMQAGNHRTRIEHAGDAVEFSQLAYP